ncbi:suppressor of fused domain protein [Hymenobacter psychrotolerans]|uniref:Suppressor of fused protein (SUFU) n=1 Tax=Hymenobacter psychrotolerans DSM 18569 TaxID=1121959 RepID=A0A1M7AKN4_9BACT|nr:suppressor of fused domain protein [Hymenobacter psychrotolerans]SHL43217.1 Suppressor of fused protein (SUFU) [Hymenobacter psychrotolerans DSM 18569]
MTEHESNPEQELTPSGSPVYRYDTVEPEEFSLASGDDTTIEAISEHIERHIGPVSGVFHELISDKVHLDVHFVEPSADFPFKLLVTSGMSDRPMTVPEGAEDWRYAELCILLPSTWEFPELGPDANHDEEEDINDQYWPIWWLKYLARFPHEYRTWLGSGHTIPNGEDAEPFAADTKLGCMLLLPSISLPEEFRELKISEEKTIYFYSLYAIYKEEMDLKMRKGVEALLDKFEEHGITDVVDLDRPNAAAKKGFLGLW